MANGHSVAHYYLAHSPDAKFLNQNEVLREFQKLVAKGEEAEVRFNLRPGSGNDYQVAYFPGIKNS